MSPADFARLFPEGAPNNAAFDAWMAKVDAIIRAKTGGLDSRDLPDWAYFDAFEDGYSPGAAALAARRAAR